MSQELQTPCQNVACALNYHHQLPRDADLGRTVGSKVAAWRGKGLGFVSGLGPEDRSTAGGSLKTGSFQGKVLLLPTTRL